MKIKIVICILVLMFSAFAGSVFGGTESDSATYFGKDAGFSNTTGSDNTYLGYQSGYSNAGGWGNTFVGYQAGFMIDNNGLWNTFLGAGAGGWGGGSNNVCIGTWAGTYESGSNKLYIANTDTTTPLIYGEFDNKILGINGYLPWHRHSSASQRGALSRFQRRLPHGPDF